MLFALLQESTEVTRKVQEEDFDLNIIIALFAIAFLFALSTWLFFIWAVKDKQFDDVEDISKRVQELDAQR